MDKPMRKFTTGMLIVVVMLFQVLMCILMSCPGTVAQPQGSIYIDCGYTSTPSYKDPATNITWESDDQYIANTTGTNFQINVPNVNPELKTLRYFNNSHPKNCYDLYPVNNYFPYFLRVSFMYGSYDNASTPFSFHMAIDGTVVATSINITNASANYEFEYAFFTADSRNSTFLCLLPDPTSHSVPFISAIALRPILNYDQNSYYYGPFIWPFIPTGTISQTRYRVNFGGNTLVRFPSDLTDRYWLPEGPNSNLLQSTAALQILTTNDTTNFNYTSFLYSFTQPPSAVMQTAITTTNHMTIKLGAVSYSAYHLNLYFAELDPHANVTSRQFGIQLDSTHDGGQPFTSIQKDVFNDTQPPTPFIVDYAWWDSYYYGFLDLPTVMTIELYPLAGSSMGPLLNGLEFYEIIALNWTLLVTDQEAAAIDDIKKSLGLTDYSGDPCSPTPYEWVNCSHDNPPTIIQINLKGYNLKGNIPSAFSKLTNLTDLILANNALSGGIPSYLINLVQLKTLQLENNQLTGEIPSFFSTMGHLTLLDVSNNNFYGNIPQAITDDNTLNFIHGGNPNLGPRPKSYLGIIIGSIVGGLVIILVTIFILKRSTLYRHMLRRGETKLIVGAARAYTLTEVVIATENFKTEIGKGGFGPVYYGVLADSQEVAVKVLGNTSCQGTIEFHHEVDLLSRVHHRHLVSLLGFCQDKGQQILIYEYMHNGSLRDHLHEKGEATSTTEILDWKSRLGIALSAALGLEYLHMGCQPSMIHRDVKSSNILISKKKSFAKVSDFGLSKLTPEDATHVSTVVKGTAGYLDPEYFTTRCLSAKSDVFSFGVVLLELVSGRLPINPRLANRNDWNICDWARATLEGGEINNLLDPIVKASQPDLDALWKVVDIAMRSVEPKSIYRPTMTEVVQHLRMAIEIEGCPPSDSPDTSDNAGVLIQSSTTTSKSMSGAHFDISGPKPR